MKKILKKYRVMSNRDDFPMTGRHIHSLRIRAFANEGSTSQRKRTPISMPAASAVLR